MSRTPTGRTREEVYRFVVSRILAGDPPTVREVQTAVGLATASAATYHLDALVADGRLSKGSAGETRSFRLPGSRHRGGASLAVPILGRVQAGALTTAHQEVEGYVSVQTRFSADEMFALRVRGDSMSPEILPDDVVIVRRQPSAEDGEVVVALVDDEATVKKLRVRRGRVELCAVNPSYAAIVPAAGELVLLGRVVELRRSLERPSLERRTGGSPRRS